MCKKVLLIALLFVCQFFMAVRGDTIPHFYTGLQANYGFIIPHSVSIEPVSHTNPYGFELSMNKLHTSFERWEVFNAYWSSGLQVGYFNFQNPEVLGSAFLLTVYAEPVLTFTRNFQLALRTGAGLSYHTKVYDEITNPTNYFFSTRISFPLYVDLRMKYRLGEHIHLTLAGCYNHISNGGLKLPNKGMNFPTVAAGVEYFYQNIPVLRKDYISELKVPKPGISFLVQFLTTVKILEETDEFPQESVFVYGFHSRIAKQLTRFYSLNAGAEMIFDGYIKETIEREGSDVDYKRFAMTAGQDFLFGKVHFTQLFGFYVYSPYEAMDPVYQKYELNFKVHPNITVGAFLKAHLQVAELMGISLSLIMNVKKKKGDKE